MLALDHGEEVVQRSRMVQEITPWLKDILKDLL